MDRPGFRLAVGLAAGLLAQVAGAAPAWADWRVAAFLGSASTLTSPVRLVQPASRVDLTFEPVTWDDESFAQPPYYGYRISCALPFARRVSIEAEFIHLKMYADTGASVEVRGTEQGMPVRRTEPIGRTIERLSISHGLNFVLVNAVYRQPVGPFASDRLALTARAGLGPTVPHGESTVRGESLDHYEPGALGWQISAGIEVRVAGGLHALMDYKYTRTTQTIGVAGGTIGTLARAHHVVFGVQYAFE